MPAFPTHIGHAERRRGADALAQRLARADHEHDDSERVRHHLQEEAPIGIEVERVP